MLNQEGQRNIKPTHRYADDRISACARPRAGHAGAQGSRPWLEQRNVYLQMLELRKV